MPEKEVVENINQVVTVYGPIFMTLFFLGTSVIYGELRGYMIISTLLLSIVLGYILMMVLDTILSYGLHFMKMAPRVLSATEPVSCLNLSFGGKNLGHKLNLSTFMYVFVITYLLTCANSQYTNSRMLFPRFAGFIVVFGYLAIHSSAASVMQMCGDTASAAAAAETETGTETEARRMGKIATLIYYNFLTILLALLLGYGSADLVLKTKTPELIHFSPYDPYSEGCRRSSRTEFSCDITAASRQSTATTSEDEKQTGNATATSASSSTGETTSTTTTTTSGSKAVPNPATSGTKEAKKVRSIAASSKRFGKSVRKIFKTKKR